MKRRPLTEEDLKGFFVAADQRPRYRAPRGTDALKQLLKGQNPWRWRRLQADFKWAQKTLRKNGHDPEEIRWLL